ncbi:glycoside hydrolase [Pseudomassariella vexata]|uniref:Glucanase n=1 Tax=Pseudomassariella vexata TaxID=1141098 RepID=A0A1Y2DPU3_9PEZI|nr:glycoside hydrolase [Pseudomassariella vexata]ORY61311.1 glycoside hydrolase [Pseudomassariella vexata]
MLSKIAVLGALLAVGNAQQVGTQKTETHPKMTWKKCTAPGSCSTVNGEITVDANWRWLHDKAGYTNCYTGNEWNSSICSDAESCASNCAVDGADYTGTYGASTSGDALTLKFVTKSTDSTNIGSRMYLMADADKYQMFTLLDNEFTFDVDLSKLGCGLNGALYFVSMDEDGGKSKYSTNKAGAKYGTGYCDAQCPRDLKFIDGKANSAQWSPSTNDKNAGVGQMGSCCSEMDIWEANSISTAFTPHPCTTVGQHACDGDACGGTYSSTRYAGDCDPDGCDFNSYRQGVTDFYGPSMTVDTTQKFTVITQFIKGADGNLESINRYYQQGGKTIANSDSTIADTSGNNINSKFCTDQKKAFGDTDNFAAKGGLAQMGKALSSGMVLVMSLWDDHYANMLWLDSTYPLDKDASAPGIPRGSCDTGSGVPADVEDKQASDTVIYSNIRFGPINSTFTTS